MTTAELVAELKAMQANAELDTEERHRAADMAILRFIGNREVSEAYDAMEKWYA